MPSASRSRPARQWHRAGQILIGGAAGHGRDGCPRRQGEGRREVGAGAEAVQAEVAAGRQIGPAQRPVADDARAEQRCRGDRVGAGRQRVGERLPHHGVPGEAAVGVVTGEPGGGAEVLPPGEAVVAAAAGLPQPGDPHQVAPLEPAHGRARGDDQAHHLVPRHHGAPVRRQLAVHDVQVGAADAAGQAPHEYLVGHGRRDRPFPARDPAVAACDPGFGDDHERLQHRCIPRRGTLYADGCHRAGAAGDRRSPFSRHHSSATIGLSPTGGDPS